LDGGNHFPTTFEFSIIIPGLIFAAISLGTAGVKHYLNLREKKVVQYLGILLLF